MSYKHEYRVAYFTTSFSSLEDAKFFVKVAFTRTETKNYLTDRYIAHFIDEKLYSLTPIYVDEHGNSSFGRTRRYYPKY